MTRRRALTSDELIRQKELAAQSVIKRLDQDIDDVEEQARRATELYTQRQDGTLSAGRMGPRAQRTKNTPETAALERAMKESFEVTRQLTAIKTEFSRLYPQHLDQLRAGEEGIANSIYQQIIYQLHDRYIDVMSHNIGYNSAPPAGVRPPSGYAKSGRVCPHRRPRHPAQ